MPGPTRPMGRATPPLPARTRVPAARNAVNP